MFRYLIRRILWAILLFLVITFVTFVIFFMAPNDPARAMCGGDQASPTCLKTATEKLGLDKPVYYQYGQFLNRLVVHQDAGHVLRDEPEHQPEDQDGGTRDGVARLRRRRSLDDHRPVGRDLLGIRPRSLIDRAAMVFVLIGVSAHPVWIGLIFSYFFGVKWHITPIADYANFFGAPAGLRRARRAGAVGLPHDPALDDVRHPVRGALRPHDQGERDGDPERGLRAHSAGQGSSGTADSLLARASERAPAGRHDARHGHRRGARRSDLHRDRVPAPRAGQNGGDRDPGNEDLRSSQGVVVFATIAILFFNLIVDLLYAWIDPRIRLS